MNSLKNIRILYYAHSVLSIQTRAMNFYSRKTHLIGTWFWEANQGMKYIKFIRITIHVADNDKSQKNIGLELIKIEAFTFYQPTVIGNRKTYNSGNAVVDPYKTEYG